MHSQQHAIFFLLKEKIERRNTQGLRAYASHVVVYFIF